MPFGPALAAGLLLASAAPAPAELFDFMGGPRLEDADAAPARAAKPRRAKPEREAKRHDAETKREQPAQGPYQLVVAIARQQVTVYGQHGAIAQAPVSTGVPEHPTPLGVFTVISKHKWHQSNIYSGAPMPYMQRITWSGIALHAGALPGYPASHGCIRLPESFAIKLWGITKVGARVIVTREAVAPVEIAHRNLFVPKKPEEKPADVVAAPTGTTEMAASSRIEDGKTADKTADVTGTIVEPAAPADIIKLPDAPKPNAELPKRKGPVSVFVSRKQNRIFVRQELVPLFDLPLTIASPERPLGTHVFTAMALTNDGTGMRWTVVSIPSGYAREAKRTKNRRDTPEPAVQAASPAAEALDRLTLPPEAIEQINALLSPGSSLIVSDNELSDETDSDTDFIVVTK